MTDNSGSQTNGVAEPLSDVEFASLKRRSVRGAAATFVSQALKFALSFGSQLVLARLLSPSEFGVVAIVTPIVGFITILNEFGLSQAIISRQELSQEELSTLFWMGLAASIALATGLIIAAPVIAHVFGHSELSPIIIVLALFMLPTSFGTQSAALMNRRVQFTELATIDLASAVLSAAVGIAAALSGLGYWSLVLAQGFGTLSSQGAAWVLAGWRPSRPIFDRGVSSTLMFGAHITTFNVVSYFSSYFDNLMVGLLYGPGALGLFDRAFRLVVQPMSQITAPISRIAVPILSRLVGNPERYRKTYLLMLQLVLLATAPGLICASVMSRQIVVALVGRDWVGTAPILHWISIAAIFSVFTGSTYWLFVSQGRSRDQMRCGLVSSFIILLSLFAGIYWGPAGIAAAYALFAPLVHGVFVWTATRRGPVKLSDILLTTYPIGVAAIVTAAGLMLLRSSLSAAPLGAVIEAAFFAYGVSGIAMLCLPQGRRLARDAMHLKGFVAAS